MTIDEKFVADYARISIFEVGDICLYDYLLMRRDAFIHYLSQTEGGRKYLKDCYISEQTEPDIEKLRRYFGTDENESEIDDWFEKMMGKGNCRGSEN